MLRGAAFFVAWWLALAGLWLLAIGVFTRTELVAALLAGAPAAGAVVLVRRRQLLRFRFRPAWLLEAKGVPWHVVRELLIVLLALAERPRSRWEELPFPTGQQDAQSAARRGFAAWAGTLSSNSLVTDLDCDRNIAVVHHLHPKRASRSVL